MKLLLKTYYFFLFLGFYLWKLLTANLYIAYDILTPVMRTNPGFIQVKVGLASDFGLLLLSNLVSMTPGTLSVELDREERVMHVHVLYMDRVAEIENEIDRYMKRIGQMTE
jgi:multisubunit Na+/H+ antiporter MnhE subunit